MGVLLASLPFLGRPEEGTSFPGTRVSGSCEVLPVVLISDPALQLPASTVFAKLIIMMMMIINCLDVFFSCVPLCCANITLFQHSRGRRMSHTQFQSELYSQFQGNHGFLVRTISMEIIFIFTYFEIFCGEDENQDLVYVSKHSTNPR